MTDSCTLPAADRPRRQAEFDGLLATALLTQTRPAPTRLRWRLRPSSAPAARDLVARESECCSFFAFQVDSSDPEALVIQIQVPPTRTDVLDDLAARATAVLE